MIRVCVDCRLIKDSGIGTFLRSSLTHLKTASLELILLCHEKDQACAEQYSTQLIFMQSPIYTLREQVEYLHKIPACDLFFSPHFNIPLGPIRAKKRLTCISDVYHLAHFASLSRAQKAYAKIFYNGAFKLSDTVITLSEFSRTEILKWATCKPKNLQIVTPSFDFLPLPAERKDFLLCVGNTKPHKNLLRLVKAYAKIRPKEPLLLVGKSEGLRTIDHQLFQAIEKNSFLKDNVHFTGFVSEERLKHLYSQARLFIFPSTYEGFGYPPLEAMASGCPVLASTAASIPDVCGDAVEYVDPYSVELIAAGLRRLLGDEKRRVELIRKGYELVQKKREERNQLVDVIHACCNRT